MWRLPQIVVMILCALVSIGAVAAVEEHINREDLFARAFRSLPFLMNMAANDELFRQKISPAEIKMFRYIDSVAQDARNRQWFKSRGVENFREKDWDRYFYAPYRDSQKAVLEAASPVRFGLKFSSDQRLFDLQEDGLVRSAVTTQALDADIFVNRLRINDATRTVTLGTAIALLIHEFGHKLPALNLPKDQSAIDSVAGKLQAYVDSQMSHRETSLGRVSILKFRTAPYNEWHETTMEGQHQGVNIPPHFEPLRIFDGEGTYIFIESKGHIHDLTDELFARVNDEDIVGGFQESYNWQRLNWILSSDINVRDNGYGEVTLEIHLNHLQNAIPFMREGVPDPAKHDLWKAAFPFSPPHVGRFLGAAYRLKSGAKPDLISETRIPLKMEFPSLRPEKVDVKWEGQDFVARYKFTLPVFPLGELDIKSKPYLILQLNGDRFEIPVTSSVGDLHEFRLPGILDKSSGTLEVVGIELGPLQPNLGQSVEPILKVFLDETDKLPMSGTRPVAKVELLEVFGWNGLKWVLMTNEHSSKIPASHLRLVFDTTEPIVSLKMHFDYRWVAHMSAQMSSGAHSVPTGFQYRQASKWVTFEARHLRQTVVDGKLYVDVLVDAGIGESQTVKRDVEIPPSERPGWMRGDESLVAFKETDTFTGENDRRILSFDFTTRVLSNGTKVFRAPLEIQKFQPTSSPTDCRSALN